MNKVTFKTGSSKVKVEGQPCVHLTSMTSHNGVNANMPSGQVIAPSQVNVIISP
jgi:leucyl aminopeptidase (aminopeptidase T)